MDYNIELRSHYSKPRNYLGRIDWMKRGVMEATIEILSDLRLSTSPSDGTSKMIGFTNSWNHHLNSIRLGWSKKKDGNIRLDITSYVNGVRRISPIGHIKGDTTGVTLMLKITRLKSSYQINLDILKPTKHNYSELELIISSESILARGNKNILPNWFPVYVLTPYFGGPDPSKSNIRFNINYKLC